MQRCLKLSFGIPRTLTKGFTLVEALIGAILLSFLLTIFSDYFLGRIKSARDSEISSAMHSICLSANMALSSAYNSAIRNAINDLTDLEGLGAFTLNISENTLNQCYDLVLTHFKDSIFSPLEDINVGVTDPLKRESRGASLISPNSGILSHHTSNSLYVNVIFLVVPHNERLQPDFSLTRNSSTPSYAWDFNYQTMYTNITFRIYHTLVVTIHTDKEGLDLTGGFPALSAYISNATLPYDCVSLLLHTECYVNGFENNILPVVHTSHIQSPYTSATHSKLQ